jgi:excinuclease ABC subunit C
MSSKIILSDLNSIPEKPGVYLMYDNTNTIIYIGKAKNLKKRVSQYFLRPQSGKVEAMVMNAYRYETIITRSEKEAFILEMNLIQTHYPRYNILLKDDKHYPYIALKKKNDPLLKIARKANDKNYYYFGPFPTSTYAYNIITLLNRIYPLRKCKNIPSSPCLYYHLGQCLAPCINKDINQKTYDDLYNNIKDFLNGKNEIVKKELKEKMLLASKQEDYENANEYKNLLDSINHINEKQDVESHHKIDQDVFAFSQREGYLSLAILIYRHGMLLGKDVFINPIFGDVNEECLSLISQYYHNKELPKQVVALIPHLKEELLSLYNLKVIKPTRGTLMELIAVAQTNAIQGLNEHFMSARLDDDSLLLLEQLAKLLHIKTPYRIELFDNSHLQGSFPVGAMVCFINAKPNKKMYRKYHIEHEEKRDDYASMKEVVFRRYSRLKEENSSYPDLLLLDGGLGQVHSSIDALKELNINIPTFGLYKNDKHQTKGLIDKDGNIYELDSKSSLFFLLMRMQDEVHRYAISFHKSLRNKAMVKSIYDDIPGLGSKRIEILQKNYPSLDDLKKASLNELSQLLPVNVAQNLYSRIKNLE